MVIFVVAVCYAGRGDLVRPGEERHRQDRHGAAQELRRDGEGPSAGSARQVESHRGKSSASSSAASFAPLLFLCVDAYIPQQSEGGDAQASSEAVRPQQDRLMDLSPQEKPAHATGWKSILHSFFCIC